MGLLKDIAVGLAVDAGDFFAKFKRAEGTMKQFGKAADEAKAHVAKLDMTPAASGMNQLKIGLGGVTAAVAALGTGFVAAKIGSTIGQAVEAASNLNETVSKTHAVLGDAAPAVIAYADEVADKFGLVKKDTLDAASAFGGLGKGLAKLSGGELSAFSIQFTKLAADLSSFANIDMKEAKDALQTGLAGNQSDVLKNLGVILLDNTVQAYAFAHGIAKMGDELTEAQKVAARSGIIMESLADAHDDLAKTAGSVSNLARAAAGRWENALADMGVAIEPITEAFYQLGTSAMKVASEALRENSAAIKDWAKEAAAGGGAVAQAFDGVTTSVGLAADAFQVLHSLIPKTQSLMFRLLATMGRWTGAANQALYDWAGLKNNDAKLEEANQQTIEDMAKWAQMRVDQGANQPWASAVIQKRADQAKEFAAKIAKEAAEAGGAAAKKAQAVKAVETKKELTARVSAEKKAAAEVKKIIDETRTPLEKYRMEVARLEKLRSEGKIDAETFRRAKLDAGKELREKEAALPKLAGALVAGSAEAYSLQAGIMAGPTSQEPIKEIAATNKQQVDLQTRMAAALDRLASRVAGSVADAALEVFSL